MKKEKILKILLFFVIIIMFFINVVNAFSITDLEGNLSEEKTKEVVAVGNKAISLISTIGSILSVIVIVILGIKYMLGSLEEKAEYKKTLMPFLIGAILIFAASNIAGVIYNLAIEF